MKEDRNITIRQNEIAQKFDVIISVLEYLDQIEKNRFIIEQYYFEQKFEDCKKQLDALLNGIAWIEYAVVLLQLNIDADEKNRLFEGFREAIDIEDWHTIVDFLSHPLVQYIRLTRQIFTQTYSEL